MKIPTESWVMAACRAAGFERVAWALRRLYCPVDRDALVLEVGSGGNPFPRSNVLVDAYEDGTQRHFAPLVTDRPTVLAFAENLPFRDGAFDFVIACHVVEHSADPAAFLGELQRVAQAGYIECPDAFFERVNPYPDHRLEVTERLGRLLIRKKACAFPNPDLIELYEHCAKPLVAGRVVPEHPFRFHLRLFWEGTIVFEVLNPLVNAAWERPTTSARVPTANSLRVRIRRRAVRLARGLLSQTWRNSRLEILPLMRCVMCRSGRLERWREGLRCEACRSQYPVLGGVPRMVCPD